MRRLWNEYSWILVLLGIGAGLAGIVVLRVVVWSVAHPDAPLWTYFLGGR
jgi:hypothetical protein